MNSELPEELPVEEYKTPRSDSPRGWQIATGIFLLTTVGFAVLWYQAQKDIQRFDWQKNFTQEWSADGMMSITRWRNNQEPANIGWDENSDGNFERWSFYDLQGNKLSESWDANEDGYMEMAVAYTPQGDTLNVSFDGDENGVSEKSFYYSGSTRIAYLDNNQDCCVDSIIVSDQKSTHKLSWEEFLMSVQVDSSANKPGHLP